MHSKVKLPRKIVERRVYNLTLNVAGVQGAADSESSDGADSFGDDDGGGQKRSVSSRHDGASNPGFGDGGATP